MALPGAGPRPRSFHGGCQPAASRNGGPFSPAVHARAAPAIVSTGFHRRQRQALSREWPSLPARSEGQAATTLTFAVLIHFISNGKHSPPCLPPILPRRFPGGQLAGWAGHGPGTDGSPAPDLPRPLLQPLCRLRSPCPAVTAGTAGRWPGSGEPGCPSPAGASS